MIELYSTCMDMIHPTCFTVNLKMLKNVHGSSFLGHSYCNTFMGVSRPSLFIESADSMI